MNRISTLLLVLCANATALADAKPGAVAITAKFPGGNISVGKVEEGRVHIAPDLRGGRPWFYWCFEAKVVKPGRVTFVFPDKVAGFKNGAIGYQGPAISKDGGKTWSWMGTKAVAGSEFYYDFTKQGQRIRFSVTLPYVQEHFAAFLKRHSRNPHLQQSVLTKSRGGRQVELLQVGKAGPKTSAVLMTCRHHANETVASYVLEGILEEAMSERPAGKAFRKEYVLFAVPFVDKDGVEKGDQGKNRRPHDHNRDYGEKSIYPEVRAIKKLGETKRVRFAIDLHCPTLVMKDHQVFYFVGTKSRPKNNLKNVSEFAAQILKRLPKKAPHGPLVWLKDKGNTTMNARYFAHQKGVAMAATLEIPFAPPGRATDSASLRAYGRSILRAWVGTAFLD